VTELECLVAVEGLYNLGEKSRREGPAPNDPPRNGLGWIAHNRTVWASLGFRARSSDLEDRRPTAATELVLGLARLTTLSADLL